MKNIILLISIMVLGNSIFSQCFPNRHNSTWYDGWISCQTAPSPNPIRGDSHWILYDFGELYALHEMRIWNTNAPDLLDWGMKEVVIDLSTDGVEWSEYGQFVFEQASGFNNYEGHFALDFENAEAKYLLITGLSNYGGNCYGLSEIKINVDAIVGVEDDINTMNDCLKANIYPNPFSKGLNLIVKSGCGYKNLSYKIVNAMGQTISPFTEIEENQTVKVTMEGMGTPGIYFVIIKSDAGAVRYRVVKI